MLTITNKNDILNSSVGSADFLCQQAPLVCVDRLTVNPTDRRTRGFLLEGKMQPGKYKRTKAIKKKMSIAQHKYLDLNPHSRLGKKHTTFAGKYNHEGYVYIYSPNHPNKQGGNYVAEHRLVMERHIGRYLGRTEDVHHINGKKDDNRIENLQLLTKSEHHKLEYKKRNPQSLPTRKEAIKRYLKGEQHKKIYISLNRSASWFYIVIKKYKKLNDEN